MISNIAWKPFCALLQGKHYMNGSSAWLTLRNTRANPFGGDCTSWTTTVFDDGLFVQEVDVRRDPDPDWGILKAECRRESHIIQITDEELAELRRLASQIDLATLQEVCPNQSDDVGWQHIECRASDHLAKYRGQLFRGWSEIQREPSPHVGLVKTAVELWNRVVGLAPFKDSVRPKRKRPRGSGRYRN